MNTRKAGTLTERQKKFVEAYLICGNKRKAAQMAGYAPSYSQGVFRMPAVKAYLEKRRKELFNQDDFTKEVIEIIARVAAGDILAAEELSSLCEIDDETKKPMFKEEVQIAAEKILMEAAGIK